jgi:hypothetical protein
MKAQLYIIHVGDNGTEMTLTLPRAMRSFYLTREMMNSPTNLDEFHITPQ